MNVSHACKLMLTFEALEDIVSNVQAHRAFATALSPFIVMSAEIDHSTQLLVWILWDPSGAHLPLISEGSVLEQYVVVITRSTPATLYDNPFSAQLKPRIQA